MGSNTMKPPSTPPKTRACPACGQTVSLQAASCPHCGQPNELLARRPTHDRMESVVVRHQVAVCPYCGSNRPPIITGGVGGGIELMVWAFIILVSCGFGIFLWILLHATATPKRFCRDCRQRLS